MSTPVVRSAKLADLAGIVRLDQSAVEIAHWPEAEYAAILADDGNAGLANLTRQIFVAELEMPENLDDNRICGFVLVKCMKLPGAASAEIENLAVEAAARRRGLGRALMQLAIDWSRGRKAGRLQLEVRAGNSAAIALYRGLGFSEAGRRPRYYSQPVEDAVLMDLVLG